MTSTEREFARAERALLDDPAHGTPNYSRPIHAAYVRAYEARERARSCDLYVDMGLGSECATCSVAPQYHRGIGR